MPEAGSSRRTARVEKPHSKASGTKSGTGKFDEGQWYMVKGKTRSVPVSGGGSRNVEPVYIARHKGGSVISLMVLGDKFYTGTRLADDDYKADLELLEWEPSWREGSDVWVREGMKSQPADAYGYKENKTMLAMLRALPTVLSGKRSHCVLQSVKPVSLKSFVTKLKETWEVERATDLASIISQAPGCTKSLADITGMDWWTPSGNPDTAPVEGPSLLDFSAADFAPNTGDTVEAGSSTDVVDSIYWL